MVSKQTDERQILQRQGVVHVLEKDHRLCRVRASKCRVVSPVVHFVVSSRQARVALILTELEIRHHISYGHVIQPGHREASVVQSCGHGCTGELPTRDIYAGVGRVDGSVLAAHVSAYKTGKAKFDLEVFS